MFPEEADMLYYKRIPLTEVIPTASRNAIDLIQAMLQFSPVRRPSASDLLMHEYFDDIRLMFEGEIKDKLKLEKKSS